jgi:amino acid permease
MSQHLISQLIAIAAIFICMYFAFKVMKKVKDLPKVDLEEARAAVAKAEEHDEEEKEEEDENKEQIEKDIEDYPVRD